MPRPKSYDRQEAVTKACIAFWEHGYQALGVRELEQLTGINQFAIRTEFGGKEGLYLEALRFYSEAAINGEMVALKGGGIPQIMTFFESLVTPGSMTSSDFGCLVVNTGIENARIKSQRLKQAVNAYWAALEQHFRQALEKDLDSQSGSTAHGPTSDDLAKALVSAVMGIHAQNRAMSDQTAGRPLVDMVRAILRDRKTQAERG